jgi:hypothetical protein
MSLKNDLTVVKIRTPEERQQALDVCAIVYHDEKRWVMNIEEFLPLEDLGSEDVSWFAAKLDGQTLGVTRVLYKLPLELYDDYGLELMDKSIDVSTFLARNRIAEVGRFAVLPEYRGKIKVAAALMRACVTETVRRGFTHFITDVFEDDPNTPHGFHKRVLGFREVATHTHGELNCESRRITMLLDFREAYASAKNRKGWLYKYIMSEWDESIKDRLSRPAARQALGA